MLYLCKKVDSKILMTTPTMKQMYLMKLVFVTIVLFGGYCYAQPITVQQQQTEQEQLVRGTPIPTCNNVNVPGWGNNGLGVVSFASNRTWTVDSQIWSDAVQASNCNKTSFNGGRLSEAFYSDCRSNPDFSGDLFSWCAVVKFQDVLCPAPWRVPTKQDLIDLNKALGSIGENTTNLALVNKYFNDWGASYSGGSDAYGNLDYQGELANYWSQTEHDAENGYRSVIISNGTISPQDFFDKGVGFTLRCVRND